MIRKAKKSDCLNLAVLSLQVWLTTYATNGIRSPISRYAISTFTESYFVELLGKSSVDIRVFEENFHLVDFIVVDLKSTFKGCSNLAYEVAALYVSPHFQGARIGRKLLKEIQDVAWSTDLAVYVG